MAAEEVIPEADDSVVETAEDPYVGTTLAEKYKILRKIGTGGMGAVYEAEHKVIGRRVAIKTLHLQFATDQGLVRRFTNEARAAAMIGHPNILECTDMGRTPDGAPFLVLELLEGADLAHAIAQDGPMTVGRIVRIATAAASALKAAHDKGIVHRDMKPENIFLVERDGNPDHVKVLDFGISKFSAASGVSQAGTQAGSVLGSPYYMSPEQVTNASTVDARADLYALGAIIYEALTGRVPHDAETLPALLFKICGELPVSIVAYRKDVPAEVVQAVEKAMARDPDDRFAGVAEFAAALAPFADVEDEPELVAEPDSSLRAGTEVSQRVRSHTRSGVRTKGGAEASRPSRRTLSVVLVVAAVLGAGGGAAAFLFTRGSATEGPPRAADAAALTASEVQGQPDAPAPAAPAEAAPEVAAPAAAPSTVMISVESPHARAEAVIGGQTYAIPFRRAFERTEGEELVAVRAPGRQGRVFHLSFAEPRSLWVELDRDASEGVRDATPDELTRALAGRPAEEAQPVAAEPSRTRPVIRARRVEEPAPEPARPAPTRATTMRSNVYVGPSSTLPAF
jgi:serine/threonine-protein kinase